MKRNLLVYLFILSAISLGGELYFNPIGPSIRVSLGTPFFFFFLLWSTIFTPVWGGVLTGATVTLFRTILMMIGDGVSFEGAFMGHYPVFFYYFSFGVMFKLLRIKERLSYLLLIGFMGAGMEVIASLIELSFRSSFNRIPVDLPGFWLIVGIALIRSFFALGFFNLLLMRETIQANEAEKKRNEQLLMLLSELGIELTILKNSIKNAEEITRDCYHLYRELMNKENKSTSVKALQIAGQIHEIKKDQQRIYAGISKTVDSGMVADCMDLEELLEMVIKTNERYAANLGKDIVFSTKLDSQHGFIHASLLLSIINNLIANSIEAIEQSGRIEVILNVNHIWTTLHIQDSGRGIPERNKSYIFEPGFTTKYDEKGQASNGIGLSHVKAVIESTGGTIHLIEPTAGFSTCFEISMPTNIVIERK